MPLTIKMADTLQQSIKELKRENVAVLRRIAKIVASVLPNFSSSDFPADDDEFVDYFRGHSKNIPNSDNSKFIPNNITEAVCKNITDKLVEENIVSNSNFGPANSCEAVRSWLSGVSEDSNARLLKIHSTLKTVKENIEKSNATVNALHGKLPEGKKETAQAFMNLQQKAVDDISRILESNEFLKTSSEKLGVVKHLNQNELSQDLSKTYQHLYADSQKYLEFMNLIEATGKTIDEVFNASLPELKEMGLLDGAYLLWSSGAVDKFQAHVDLAKHRESKKVGGADGYGDHAAPPSGAKGGEMYPVPQDEDDAEAGVNMVDKRIRYQKTQKSAIVREYRSRVHKEIINLTLCMKDINKHLESSRLVSDRAMLDFKMSLTTVLGGTNNDLFTMPFKASFIKKHNDSSSRSEKVIFMSSLKRLSSLATKFARSKNAGEFSGPFVKFAQSIDKLIETIDSFTSHLNEKFGSGISPDESVADTRLTIGYQDLKNEIAKFGRYFYVAQVRENFKRSATETKHYAESYEKTLGSAIADLLEKKRVEHSEKMEKFDELSDDMFYNSDELKPGNEFSGRDKIKKFLNTEMIVRENFYKVLQTVDLYLQKFTGEIALGPEELKDIKGLLDGSQTITRWFDKELFSKYEALSKFAEDDQKDIEACDENIRMLFDNFSAIKSIINAFMRIGDKLNGSELHSKMVISPKACFNHISNFIRHSSISIVHDKEKGKLYSRLGENYDGTYRDEYHFFVTMTKAMVAKIVAVLDASEMFINPRAPDEHIKNIRMIVGGGDDPYTSSGYDGASESYDSEMTIYPQATELYYRIPPLVEYYQKFFENVAFANATSDGKVLGMIPEIDGVFAGILKFYMIDNHNEPVRDQLNSDHELKKLIAHVNKIYLAFKDENGDVSVHDVADKLKNEINRRIGLVKSQDLMKYFKLVDREKVRGLDDVENLGLNSVGDQLFGEENDYELSGEISRDLTQMPSDKYFYNGSSKALNKINNEMLLVYGKLLSQFKSQIGFDFSTETNRSSNNDFFIEDISRKLSMFDGSTHKQMPYLRQLFDINGETKRENYDVVTTDLLMFHETVVSGITTVRLLLDCLDGDILSFLDSDDFHDLVKGNKKNIDETKKFAFAKLAAGAQNYHKIDWTVGESLVKATKINTNNDKKDDGDFDMNEVDDFGHMMRMFARYLANNEKNECSYSGPQKLKSILRLRQLLSIKSSQSGFFFDFKNYKKLLNDFLVDCRFYMEDFRSKGIPKEILDKYEGIDSTGKKLTSNPYTLQYIENEIESLFDEHGNNSENNANSRKTAKRNFIKKRLNWITSYKPTNIDIAHQVYHITTKELNNIIFDMF